MIQDYRNLLRPLPANEQGEPTASYKWTGLVRQMNRLKKLKTARRLPTILDEFIEYTPIW